MAIVTFKEISDGREGGEEISGRRSLRRYTRVFRAVTDSNDDEATVILQYADCPRIGSLYPWDLDAYCRRVRPRNESFGKRVWIVTAAYSTEQELEENPVDDPVKVNWGTEQFRQAVWEDIDGMGILTLAGEEFDPPAEKDDSRVTATITGNFSLVPTWIFEFADTVNADAFVLDGVTIPAGLAKVSGISVSEEKFRNEISYRTVTIVLHFRRQLEGKDRHLEEPKAGREWNLWVLNAGFEEKVKGEALKRQKITLSDGKEPTIPQLLDKEGYKMDDPDMNKAIFLSFQVYAKEDFLDLPGTSEVVP